METILSGDFSANLENVSLYRSLIIKSTDFAFSKEGGWDCLNSFPLPLSHDEIKITPAVSRSIVSPKQYFRTSFLISAFYFELDIAILAVTDYYKFTHTVFCQIDRLYVCIAADYAFMVLRIICVQLFLHVTPLITE